MQRELVIENAGDGARETSWKPVPDYRQYIKKDMKKFFSNHPDATQRRYADKINLSPPRLSEILTGRSKISRNRAKKIADHMEISLEEKNLFILSAAYHSQRAKEKKEAILERIKEYEETAKSVEIDGDDFFLISEWYHLAILEAAAQERFASNPRNLGEYLQLDEEVLVGAIRRLKRLGLIKGDLEQIKKVTRRSNTGDSAPSEAIRKHHKNHLMLALRKIDSENPDRRNNSSLTVSMDAETYGKACELLKIFRRQFLGLTEKCSATEKEIYSLNINLTPLGRHND